MAIVVNSDGALEYFDTFAALAQYNLDHADDTIESYNAEVEEENSIVTLQLTNADADTIVNIDSDVVVIDASKRKNAINITGNEGNNSIRGGTGADTLGGALGNDTLTGGKGKDVFVYSGGNDVITDYVSGTDKIKISNATIASSDIDEGEGDAIFSIEGGGLLIVKNVVKNGKSKKITIIDAKGVTSSQTYGSGTITIANSDGNKINMSANTFAEIADASKRTTAVYIIGNSNDNVLKGGKGADTLDGGSETSDTLTGGGGSDVFIYNGGDDVITDYNPQQGDIIKLVNSTFDTYSISGKDAVFETSAGELTFLRGISTKSA